MPYKISTNVELRTRKEEVAQRLDGIKFLCYLLCAVDSMNEDYDDRMNEKRFVWSSFSRLGQLTPLKSR
jgi:hypothetical protein